MIRKVVLLAMAAMAVTAFAASTASAQVTVHNPGMFELTGNELQLVGHHPLAGAIVLSQCENSWEANVDSSGHVSLHSVAIDPPGTGNCDALNDCDDAGWEGQITSPTAIHVNFCLEGAAAGDITAEATCTLNGTTHIVCADVPAQESVGAPLPLEINGELDSDSAIDVE
jgi:hypothetical protein